MNNTTETIVTTIDFLRKAKHVLPTAEEIMQLANFFNGDFEISIIKISTEYLIVSLYHVTYPFRVNLHSVIAWMSRISLLETGAIPES